MKRKTPYRGEFQTPLGLSAILKYDINHNSDYSSQDLKRTGWRILKMHLGKVSSGLATTLPLS